MLSLQIYSDPQRTRLLADLGSRIVAAPRASLSFSTNGHGFAGLTAGDIPMALTEAFEVYTWPGTPHVVVSDGGAVIWEGRLEDIDIVAGGVSLAALGYQRALYDLPYTALWSRTGTADWRAVTAQERSWVQTERYQTDNNNRLYIAPKKGEAFDNDDDHGELTFSLPHNGARDVAHVAADYVVALPANWNVRLMTCDHDFGNVVTEATLTTTGSAQTGSWSLTTAARRRVLFGVRNMTGSAATISADTGTWFARLTSVRVASVAPPVLASDIAAGLTVWVNATNDSQLRADRALVEATDDDLLDELYEDQLPAAILDRLAVLNGYEWGVYEDRRLHWRAPAGGRQWYVDTTTTPRLGRSIENLRNSAYATYRSAAGRTFRTALADDVDSRVRYGLTRRGFINVQTTSTAEANRQRDVFLGDRATLATRAEVEFDRLYDAAGSVWPLYAMRAGDTVTIRNLPPTLSTEIDRIRTFRVAETEFDATAGTLTVVPEEPPPTLVTLVARREAGLR